MNELATLNFGFFGLCTLLSLKLPGAKVNVSFKGRVGGGINDVFFRSSSELRVRMPRLKKTR